MFAIRQRKGGDPQASSTMISSTIYKGALMAAYFGGIRLAYWVVNFSGLFQENS
jgi:hypothetical protein